MVGVAKVRSVVKNRVRGRGWLMGNGPRMQEINFNLIKIAFSLKSIQFCQNMAIFWSIFPVHFSLHVQGKEVFFSVKDRPGG